MPALGTIRWGAVALTLGAIALSLVVVEVLLRVVMPVPTTSVPDSREHDELHYVLGTGVPDVDQFGFRNRNPPEGQKIFAVGDSHTYGYNVSHDEAWPTQLGSLAGKGVYNLGVPWYNIYQYFRTFEIALSLQPEFIIVGLHPANDISRPSCGILDLDYWKARISELGLRDEFCRQFNASVNAQRENRQTDSAREVGGFGWKDLALVNAATRFLGGGGAPRNNASYFVLLPDSDLKVQRSRVGRQGRYMDIRDKVVFENFNNSKTLFAKMKALADRRNVGLGVMLIPSKQRVMGAWATRNKHNVPRRMRGPLIIENTVIGEYRKFFESNAIPVADATNTMIKLLDQDIGKGELTYKPDDGHPFAAGNLAYAETALELLGAQ